MIVRTATAADAPAMADILNRIIAIGGTTAHEHPMPVEDVLHDYIEGQQVIAAVVAEDQGCVIGWQSVGLWQAQGHIGTFVAPGIQAKGIGAAMFAMSCDLVAKAGVTAIIASIRADNVPGLAYYARLGFVDFAHDPDFALTDGRIVGRVHRRYDIA